MPTDGSVDARISKIVASVDRDSNGTIDCGELAQFLRSEKGPRAEEVAKAMTKDGPLPGERLFALIKEDVEENGVDVLATIEQFQFGGGGGSAKGGAGKKKIAGEEKAGLGSAADPGAGGEAKEADSEAGWIYEVNVQLPTDQADVYRAWLAPHCQELLKVDGFIKAQIFERSPADEGGPADALLTVHYLVRDRKAIDTYIRDHAPALREDGKTRFPAATVNRRILRLADTILPKKA